MYRVMILLFRIIGQDQIDICVAHASAPAPSFECIGSVVFDKDKSHLLLKAVIDGLEQQEQKLTGCTAIAVQWSDASRFTVSRLTGVTANTLAQALHVPIIACAQEVSENDIVALVQNATVEKNASIDIEYSGEPTITIKEK